MISGASAFMRDYISDSSSERKTTSPMPITTSSSYSSHDLLYRELYLRREYALVSAKAAISARLEECCLHHAPYPSAKFFKRPGEASVSEMEPALAGSVSLSNVSDVLLLPPLASDPAGALIGGSRLSSPNTLSSTEDKMLAPPNGWSGLVYVSHQSSPWYGACFAFTVYFPSRYPFECPVLELTEPIDSLPVLQKSQPRWAGGQASSTPLSSDAMLVAENSSAFGNGRIAVPFHDVYCNIAPMEVSIMVLLLQRLKVLFYPELWPVSLLQQCDIVAPKEKSIMESEELNNGNGAMTLIDRVKARRDVERRSITKEVMLEAPYVKYLSTEVTQHFMRLWSGDKTESNPPGADTMDSVPMEPMAGWAHWFGRTALPDLRKLP